MSGILDSRQRIMDTIVTLEGRRQIADGKLRVEYVSFTDSATFYQADAVSGSSDATNRLYFEQCHLPQDQITFEADDSGKIKPFKNASEYQILGGNIYTSTTSSNSIGTQTFTGLDYEYLTNEKFVSAAENLIASSVDNYKKLHILGTKDTLLLEEEQMQLSNENITFQVTFQKPLDQNKKQILVSSHPSIFYNKLFSKSKNFHYLPPINKINDPNVDKTDKAVIQENMIGEYADLKNQQNFSFQDLNVELQKAAEGGQKRTISFDFTSLNNMLLGQFFEITSHDMLKLDMFEFGTFKHEGKMKQVFFVGKILTDDNQTDTFFRIFTLVFE